MKHRPALDGVRGLAVAAVVVYHFAPTALPGGFLGVDLFFVLSGFLITSLLVGERQRTGRVDVVAFWGRRLRRLLPAALLALIVIMVLSVRTGNVTPGLPADLLATLGYVNNWHQIAANQSYFALFSAPSPTKHFWSLAIEEQFYLVWPIVVAAAVALLARRRRRRAISAGLLVVGVAASAIAMWWFYSNRADPSRAYYGTDTRAFELLIGALLAVLVRPERVRARPALTVAGAVAAVACGMAMFRWSDSTGFYYQGGALLWATGAAIIVAALLPTGPLATAFAIHPLRWLGLISYGVYLFHWPIGLWLDDVAPDVAAGWRFGTKVAVTLVVATLSYLAVELPIRHRRVLRPGVRAKLAPPLALAGTALLVVLLVLPLAPPSEVDGAADAAEPSTPNTAMVFSKAAPGDESASGSQTAGAPALSETDRDAILAVAAADQQRNAAQSTTTTMPAWVPPPPPPLLGAGLAQRQADISLVTTCFGRTQPPLAEYRDNGTGRLVGVIGDSMTAQMRDTILRDKSFDWFVIARCGMAVFQFDHPGHQDDGLPEVFAKLLFMHPRALIIALGITDVTRHLDYVASIANLIDVTKDVPCRSWVTLWPNQQMNHHAAGLSDGFQTFDDDLAAAAAGGNLRLLDWGSRVASVPPTSLGYHPWLNPIDWVHLIPGQGFEQRLALMKSGLDGCF